MYSLYLQVLSDADLGLPFPRPLQSTQLTSSYASGRPPEEAIMHQRTNKWPSPTAVPTQPGRPCGPLRGLPLRVGKEGLLAVTDPVVTDSSTEGPPLWLMFKHVWRCSAERAVLPARPTLPAGGAKGGAGDHRRRGSRAHPGQSPASSPGARGEPGETRVGAAEQSRACMGHTGIAPPSAMRTSAAGTLGAQAARDCREVGEETEHTSTGLCRVP